MINKNLKIEQNTDLVLNKSKATLSTTDKVLSGQTSLATEVIEDWIKKIWKWADENDIPDYGFKLSKLKHGRPRWPGFPRDKEELLYLNKLNLTENQLLELPKEIGNLTNLDHLDLEKNELTALPKEIGNFTNLVALDLSGNELIALPKEIENLTNLLELKFSPEIVFTRRQEIWMRRLKEKFCNINLDEDKMLFLK